MTDSKSEQAKSHGVSRANPYLASITANFPLTKEGSEKETRHIVIDIRGSGISYQVGDSLGIFPSNPPYIVEAMLQALSLEPEEEVTSQNAKISLKEFLSKHVVLTRVTKKFVQLLQQKVSSAFARKRLEEILQNEKELESYLWGKDYLDLLEEYPGISLNPDELVSSLGRMVPRLYSIASSPLLFPEEVHLTVAVVKYKVAGRMRYGVATGYLSRFAKIGVKEIPVYNQPAKHFHLPEDPSADIIMIGPGTGIAPFRAFLQHRTAAGHRGKNWLFFGEQHQKTDFLYHEELLNWLNQGILTRLDTAFSRDQPYKVYVQHKMKAASKDLWDWLQRGAYVYVCGDAKRMAKDVHQTLIEIAMEEGRMSQQEASHYINVVLAKEQKRYRKDVY
ncbi:sulfite reductase subunit alpha [Candidatus Methylacidiphilum infernorum]|uniref:Sulfite reductase subunit alpha n=1 Tax=Candidatus Methylacidiphilum infernorum TaxID=511746 RepID=A0ABX7PX68_9BACT|nr:sulfite reductase subunit alpha [Candidatus Methylacidiphilum infernorum]QSR87314.1 sulfite reductase subunit alpha [Candidatus Methylacidiphilum infernorum]